MRGNLKISSVPLLAALVIFFGPGIQAHARGLDHLLPHEGDLLSSDYPQQIQFRGVSFSSGRKGHDVEFSAGTYDSTDGVGVVATTETYPSPSRARAQLIKRIKNATKLIERERKTDANRRFMGERVVLMEPGNSPGLAYATVLWLQRQELSIIQSSSLETALKFEQQFHSK